MDAFFLFSVGIGLLLISASTVVRSVVAISRSMRISPLVVGTTVAAIGTSLPELAVSGFAVFSGDVGLAVGNIVGSNVINIFLIFAVGVLSGRLRVGTTKTQRTVVVLALSTVAFLVATAFPFPAAGLWLLTLAGLVTVVEYYWGIVGRNHEDARHFPRLPHPARSATPLFLLLFSVVGLFLGGSFTVSSVEQVAQMTGLSTTFLGLTLTAVATSLPELLVTVFSFRQHQEKILLGNILGSNIYNLLLIGGVIGTSAMLLIDWRAMVWLVISTILVAAVIVRYRGATIDRRIGGFFLLILVLYLVTLK